MSSRAGSRGADRPRRGPRGASRPKAGARERRRQPPGDVEKSTLLDLASEAIFIIRLPDSVITYWNAGATRLYGWAAEEAVGRRSYELLRTQHDRPRQEIVGEAIREGHWVGSIVQRRRDGAEIIVEGRWTAQLDAASVPVAILEINRDVTAERAAEAAKQSFLNLVSHEMRTPLTVIKGYTSLLSAGVAGALPETMVDALDAVARETASLERMIETVLLISRLSHGEGARRLSSLDLNALVTAAVGRAEEDVPPGVTVAFSPGEPVPVLGDESFVAYILDALLENAAGFSPSGTAVEVEVERSPAPAVLVKDHGPGIAVSERQHLFEPFGRVSSQAQSPRRGFGLGLFSSRQLARAMNGEVSLEWSELGQGSVFALRMSAPSPAIRVPEAPVRV